MAPTWTQKAPKNGVKIDAKIDPEPKWRLGRASGRYKHPFGDPILVPNRLHLGAQEASRNLQELPKTFKIVLKRFRKIRRRNRRADLRTIAAKRPPGTSKSFQKHPKTTFRFTDRQEASVVGIVEQTSERLTQNGGRRSNAVWRLQ